MPQKTSIASNDRDNIQLLYRETAEFARTFIEWRYKVISMYFFATSGVLIIAKWFWESLLPRGYVILPLGFGAIFCAALALLDHANHRILCANYKIAREFETHLYASGGFYAFLHRRVTSPSTVTYARVLQSLFWLTTTVFLLMAVIAPFAARPRTKDSDALGVPNLTSLPLPPVASASPTPAALPMITASPSSPP